MLQFGLSKEDKQWSLSIVAEIVFFIAELVVAARSLYSGHHAQREPVVATVVYTPAQPSPISLYTASQLNQIVMRNRTLQLPAVNMQCAYIVIDVLRKSTDIISSALLSYIM